MPVIVYEDYRKLRFFCVLDDDGRVYDKPDHWMDNLPRKQLGNFDSGNRLFYGKDHDDEAGCVDWDGYVYNHPDDKYRANRVGYVFRNEVYDEGPCGTSYPPGSPLVYMEGDGDMHRAGAAYLLLIAGRGAPVSRGSYSSSTDDDHPHPVYYGSSSGGGSSTKGCGTTLLIFFIVCALIVYAVFGPKWRERKEAREEADQLRHEAVVDAINKKHEAEQIAKTEGWVQLDENHGRYRTSFTEGGDPNFTFIYNVSQNCSLSFSVEHDSKSNLKTSSYILYRGYQYDISTELNVTAGDQVSVIVDQISGAGYFNIHTYKGPVNVDKLDGWLQIDDTHGRYRTSFLTEGANDTFTFTYTVSQDAKIDFDIEVEYPYVLELSAYMIYDGEECNLYYHPLAKAGEKIVVIVTQTSGTGFFNLHVYESPR